MSEDTEANSMNTGSSPWPMFIAFGLVLSEIGVLFALRPVSVGGLLLFVGTTTGLLVESGYVTHPTRSISAQGIALLILGGVLILRNQTGTTIRGQSIAIAGMLCLIFLFLRIGYSRIRFGNTNQTSDRSESSFD